MLGHANLVPFGPIYFLGAKPKFYSLEQNYKSQNKELCVIHKTESKYRI